jgi:hypothetical protein
VRKIEITRDRVRHYVVNFGYYGSSDSKSLKGSWAVETLSGNRKFADRIASIESVISEAVKDEKYGVRVKVVFDDVAGTVRISDYARTTRVFGTFKI